MGRLAFFRAFLVLFLATAGPALSIPAKASDRVSLTFHTADDTPSQTPTRHPQLSVAATAGRYDRVLGERLAIPLVLSAEIVAEGSGHKILGFQLSLKSSSGGSDTPWTGASDSLAPVRSLTLNRSFDFSIAPQAVVAQEAIALCNARLPAGRTRGGAQELDLAVPVIWRVKTGRFNFQWTNYDRVAPTAEIQNNPDFYAELETAQAETTAHISVLCQPIAAEMAANSPPAATRSNLTGPSASSAPPVASAVRLSPVVNAAPVSTALVAPAEIPTCEGGMVRRLTSGETSYLCLCPGNTQRVQVSPNAYACERAARRR